ncbi:MobV family relaxase, partial [Priestia megaterium]|uniref:MobV family relaxase n=1 Tax=Priestia megaterium TaxID=1404 RepID=UPI0030001E25
MSYSILRVEGIKTLGDLRGLGKHNVDRVSETNLDIDKEKSAENIQLIECDSYLKRFNEITAEMRAEHNARMETIRADRQKTFEQAINSAHNDVACEFLCTSDEEFFQGRSRAEIETWARQSLEFIEQEVGISKDKIIHASVHMDEKTPHLHVVAVPLLRAWDGRRKEETLQISRKKFIKTKEDMSLVQDKYHEKMKSCGYDMQRGESKNVRHEKIVEFKEKTNYHQEVAQQSREEASKVKQEVKSLHTKQTGLEISILNREYELKELNKKAEEVKSLDEIEVKEKGGLL